MKLTETRVRTSGPSPSADSTSSAPRVPGPVGPDSDVMLLRGREVARRLARAGLQVESDQNKRWQPRKPAEKMLDDPRGCVCFNRSRRLPDTVQDVAVFLHDCPAEIIRF